MKLKIAFCLATIKLMALYSNAQRGNNQVQNAAESGIPSEKFVNIVNTGFGGSAKGLSGVGSVVRLSLTSGYTI